MWHCFEVGLQFKFLLIGDSQTIETKFNASKLPLQFSPLIINSGIGFILSLEIMIINKLIGTNNYYKCTQLRIFIIMVSYGPDIP